MVLKTKKADPKEIREGKSDRYAGHDELIDEAKEYCKYGFRTDAYAEGVGFLGMDDIDRMRRRKIH